MLFITYVYIMIIYQRDYSWWIANYIKGGFIYEESKKAGLSCTNSGFHDVSFGCL